MLAVDYVPGFEATFAASSPLDRYSAFILDTVGRYRASPELRADHAVLWTTLQTEERRLCRDQPEAWADGAALRLSLVLDHVVDRSE
jgi:hypothetical protein